MKSFSELTSASQVNNEDLLAISQESGGTYSSKKTTVEEVTDIANLNVADKYDSTSTYAVGDFVIYDSILYKCVTAVSVAEAFDSTKWTQVIVTDEMGGNANEMVLTYAQYQALSEAQKMNGTTYYINDISGNNPNWINYSTTEQVIGSWIDGSILYQKTISVNSGGNLNTGDNHFTHNISNLAKVIDASGCATRGTGSGARFMVIPYASKDGNVWDIGIYEFSETTGIVNVGTSYSGQYVLSDCYVTIRYTKSS